MRRSVADQVHFPFSFNQIKMQAVSVEVVGDPVGGVKIPCVDHILLKSLVVVD